MTCRDDEIFCRLLHVLLTKVIVKNKRNISFIQKDILVFVLRVMEFLSRRKYFLATTLPSSI
jgi:hypothetical protein